MLPQNNKFHFVITVIIATLCSDCCVLMIYFASDFLRFLFALCICCSVHNLQELKVTSQQFARWYLVCQLSKCLVLFLFQQKLTVFTVLNSPSPSHVTQWHLYFLKISQKQHVLCLHHNFGFRLKTLEKGWTICIVSFYAAEHLLICVLCLFVKPTRELLSYNSRCTGQYAYVAAC